ncbi:MAG TPA: hypothetical protein VGX23_37020 [Actinocrinis sp.]|nr:hypothetical protein [Actinocrinis sp.]
MMKRSAISLAAITLAASQSGGCGGGDSSHGTAVGASPAVVTCTEDSVGGDSGISIIRGLVTGTMQLVCTGGVPDTYDFTMILMHNQTMVEAKGNKAVTIPPDSKGTEVERFADCGPGSWHIYYLVTWTLGGTTVHNTKTVTSDRSVSADEC